MVGQRTPADVASAPCGGRISIRRFLRLRPAEAPDATRASTKVLVTELSLTLDRESLLGPPSWWATGRDSRSEWVRERTLAPAVVSEHACLCGARRQARSQGVVMDGRRMCGEARNHRNAPVRAQIAAIQAEIDPAPDEVKGFFDDILEVARIVEVSDDALALRQAYLEAGILTRDSADDALHVALATVSGCALIVSWNFKHIVHYRKVPLYNAVNALKGYPSLGIHSPQEVIEYEDQDI